MSLKNTTIRSVAWNGIGNVATQIIKLGTLVVMARLLSPADYGVYAILMVFVGFFTVLAGMGVAQAVVYLDHPNDRMLSSIFYLNLAVGVMLYGLMFALAYPISIFYANPDLVQFLRLIALVFVVGALNTVQQALMEKMLIFKRVVLFDLSSQVVGAAVGLGAAFAGYGVLSLIYATLASAAAKAVLLWLGSAWRPKLMFAMSDVKTVANYCFNLTGFSIINYFSRNADNFLIGKYIGAPALGVYNLAYNIMLYPLNNVSSVIGRVLFPAMASMKHDTDRLKRAYLKVISFIALVTFPLMAGLTVVANTFVTVVFGNKWSDLAPLLIILAPVGLIQSIVTTVGTIYTVRGTTSLMFKLGSWNAAVTVLSFLVGLPFGVEGVAISYAISNLFTLYPNLKYAWNQIGLGVGEGLLALKDYLFAAFLMATSVYLITSWLSSLSIDILAIFAVQIFSGIVIYFITILLVTRFEVVSMIKDITNK